MPEQPKEKPAEKPKLQQQAGKPAPLEITQENGQTKGAVRRVDPNLCPNCGKDLLHVPSDGLGMKLCPGCRMHVSPPGVELL